MPLAPSPVSRHPGSFLSVTAARLAILQMLVGTIAGGMTRCVVFDTGDVAIPAQGLDFALGKLRADDRRFISVYVISDYVSFGCDVRPAPIAVVAASKKCAHVPFASTFRTISKLICLLVGALILRLECNDHRSTLRHDASPCSSIDMVRQVIACCGPRVYDLLHPRLSPKPHLHGVNQ